MIPLGDDIESREIPVLTWTLIGLNLLVFLWDRGWQPWAPSMAFQDLGMRPNEISLVLKRQGVLLELGKVFTSFFLHGDLWHLLVNMLFLYAFGRTVERAVGGVRFALYYLFWGMVAAATHVFVDPQSAIPTLGASGAIGGVLGCYFLLFPANWIRIVVFPFVVWSFEVRAYILLGLWFVWQIVFPQMGVANWAHAGGFMAGMLTVQVMGGRMKVIERWRGQEAAA